MIVGIIGILAIVFLTIVGVLYLKGHWDIKSVEEVYNETINATYMDDSVSARKVIITKTTYTSGRVVYKTFRTRL